MANAPLPAPAGRPLSNQIEALALQWLGRDSVSDRDFAALLTLLGPRIGRLIRRYRLDDMTEDARQAAAIGVYRALMSFDPDRASFAVHAAWQIKGELQSLRHRVRLDQRRSARGAGITTVSLCAMQHLADERAQPYEIIDETARERTESGASDAMALRSMGALLDQLDAPLEERSIVIDHLLDRPAIGEQSRGQTAEQRRQIVRRTFRNCIKLMAA